MNGLATLAICWPEFKFSQSWLTYAQFHMSREIELQVYPDGSHKELTSHYHRVTLLDFDNFAKLMQLSGHNLSISFGKTLERMWNYLAFAMRPDGSSPSIMIRIEMSFEQPSKALPIYITALIGNILHPMARKETVLSPHLFSFLGQAK